MPLIVDSSVAACWALPDETSEVANRALAQLLEDTMLVPSLFWYEIRNVLIVNERRGRISLRQTEEALARMKSLSIETDEKLSGTKTMELARHHTLSFYDAAYLELAWRSGSTLTTLDRRLRHAGRTAGVRLFGEA